MKYILKISCILLSLVGYAQSNTEVFLFDLETNNTQIELKNAKNLSNNEGYDNQPSFLNDRYIVFVSTRNGQTDISKYDMRYDSKSWLNFTEGGEYTPLKIPNKNDVSAVRLDPDGLQRLYAYNMSNGESTELIKDLVVAYYTWYDEHTVVSAVIEDNNLNLYTTNIEDGKSTKYATKVGRSFHKIPSSNLVSFISKQNENQWQIKSLNPLTGAIKVIANTMEGVEDICWLDSRTILSGKDNILYKLTLRKDNNWKQVTDLSSNGIVTITRLSVNTESNKLLIAADINATPEPSETTEESTTETSEETSENPTNTNTQALETLAAQMVQKHIEPYNNRQLNEFANAFDINVKVNRFPNDRMYSGRSKLKENYKQFYKNNAKSHVKVLNRITLNTFVIDEELTTVNLTTGRQVTIYETDADNINSMTFLNNATTTSNPEVIVNKQLEAYNNKDIDAFVATYSTDAKLYNYPNTLNSNGLEALRKQYASFFQQTPDLNAEIQNRIVLGNKVIDREKVLINGKVYYAIAIYEIENEKIVKVTFIQ